MTHDLRNKAQLLGTLAGLGVKEYWAWCPIDTMRSSEMIGIEQHGSADFVTRHDDGSGSGGNCERSANPVDYAGGEKPPPKIIFRLATRSASDREGKSCPIVSSISLTFHPKLTNE
jgi:hypothetical protein